MASLTSGSGRVSAGAWVAEARGVERRRRAVACRIGRLTGTRAPRWTGEIGEQEWRTILAVGVAALADSAAAPRTAPEEKRSCSTCGARLNRASPGTVCGPCLASSAHGPAEQAPAGTRPAPDMGHLADTAREVAPHLTSGTGGGVVDRTRNGRVEALVDELLAARPAGALDVVGEDERKLVAKWSPFRGGPRHVVRCADGSRRYGNGGPAREH
ncbi:hypothetical protein [Kitasatospora purpeofusca]|uniref:hypothetical protein n=1 Tax=Kitasatospora purpeofusca TaxID=67352 RepID=UPI0022599B93|nr:hypothetical protein [Kitasatospora purpeofusca]MCX4754301.1 hypothetical protein [Kitasatospora purpeofusca]WSR33729.1 hypothetical protein OG715_23795 [Kitasatospora purpeofusca]